jgi:hypothetical protein
MPVNRTVRLHEAYNVVHEVPHVDDLSFEERLSVWYLKKDFAVMRLENNILVHTISNGTTPSDACTRGLEDRTHEASSNKRIAVTDGLFAVLSEQDQQNLVGVRDPEQIRVLYMECTKRFFEEARTLGINDVEAVGYEVQVEAAPLDSASSSSSSRTKLAQSELVEAADDDGVVLTKKSQKPVSRLQKFIGSATKRRRNVVAGRNM